ncbi:MAG: ADP-ribosylglycohydrolase family protein [Caldilineaceae bacterium]
MQLPQDYFERVYAGVLGKIIGVYLGRPFEGWWYDKIMADLGEIWYYQHERRDKGLRDNILIVTDDDISGTFTFLRALEDYGLSPNLTAEQIGQSWLNYIIERRTILWWGGMGNSTEHTAFLRLKNGIPAPRSGSIALNGKVVAEQIGSQIFIDGWAMVSPGDPAQAADLARRAASVSHDGEAIYGAQVIAAMEAAAFVERDLNKLIDIGVSFIPKDSIIYRMISDIREWREEFGDQWRSSREQLEKYYGYDTYGGNCHMVPNHGVILMSLLHGDDDFQKSLMIANTAGWDTDCNSGNVGCLLGIKNGLQGIDAGPDWRGPVADRLYLATAEGGRAITDAVQVTQWVTNLGRSLAGEAPLNPKDGARYHFELPGSVQGFMVEASHESAETSLENGIGYSHTGSRSLAIRYQHLAPGRYSRVATATFTPPEAVNMKGYELHASPTLYPGQTVRTRLTAHSGNGCGVTVQLYIRCYGAQDQLERVYGPETVIGPADHNTLQWRIPETGGRPIAEIGLELRTNSRADGTLFLDYLTWEGGAECTFTDPEDGGQMWRRAWVNGIDQFDFRWAEPYRLCQNSGRGLLMTGTRDWRNYRAISTLTPHLVTATGVAVHVQGMRRYYALLLAQSEGKPVARLVKVLHDETVLAEAAFDWSFGTSYELSLQVNGNHLQGFVNGKLLLDVNDEEPTLRSGGIALICEEGRVGTSAVQIVPA